MSSYTFNKFKQKLKNMDNKQRGELLKDLQANLMFERTQNFSMGQSKGQANIWVMRKKIAIIKTAIKCWR